MVWLSSSQRMDGEDSGGAVDPRELTAVVAIAVALGTYVATRLRDSALHRAELVRQYTADFYASDAWSSCSLISITTDSNSLKIETTGSATSLRQLSCECWTSSIP